MHRYILKLNRLLIYVDIIKTSNNNEYGLVYSYFVLFEVITIFILTKSKLKLSTESMLIISSFSLAIRLLCNCLYLPVIVIIILLLLLLAAGVAIWYLTSDNYQNKRDDKESTDVLAEDDEDENEDDEEEATPEPTEEPTPEPTEEPTPEPTEEPTPEPTEEPTPEPTEEPEVEPTEDPEAEPTEEPENNPKLEVEFSITSANPMEFDAAGGAGEITYEVKNFEGTPTVIARRDVAWIENLTSAENT